MKERETRRLKAEFPGSQLIMKMHEKHPYGCFSCINGNREHKGDLLEKYLDNQSRNKRHSFIYVI